MFWEDGSAGASLGVDDDDLEDDGFERDTDLELESSCSAGRKSASAARGSCSFTIFDLEGADDEGVDEEGFPAIAVKVVLL